VPLSFRTPLQGFLSSSAATSTRCALGLATWLPTPPGRVEPPAPFALFVRKTMSLYVMRSLTALLRSSLALPISQGWMTFAPMLLSGSQFLSLGGLLSIYMLLAQAFLEPCCVFGPLLLPQRLNQSLIVHPDQRSLAWPWPSGYCYLKLPWLIFFRVFSL